MAVTLLLVREAGTAWDADERLRGRTPLPARPEELAELQRAAPELASCEPSGVYAPPTDPGRQSGRVLREALGLPLWLREELVPLDTGAWEGLTLSELRERNKRAWRRWRADPTMYGPPRGETLDDVAARLHPFVEDLLVADETAVVVAGDLVVGALLARVCPAPGERSRRVPSPVLEGDERWVEQELVTDTER
jgi:probable phosphoglycerate mutase